MPQWSGSCHCGQVHVAIRTKVEPEAIVLRECQCGFCRRHGAKTFADPAGEASISGTERLTRYRFGQATADFLLCSRCGVYVAAVIEHEGRHFATINAAGLQIPLLATRSATPVSYEGEDAEARRQRRLDRWMPVVLNEDRGVAHE